MEHNDRTKLIIDIPKDYYEAICTRAKYLGEDSTILTPEERAIAKGSYLQTKYEDIKTDISQNVEIIGGKVYIKEYDLYQILHQHFVFKEEKGENNQKPIKRSKYIDGDLLFSKIAGHSDYHGDSILSAISCLQEGKEISTISAIGDNNE